MVNKVAARLSDLVHVEKSNHMLGKIMLGFKILDGKCNLMWATEQLTKFCERDPGIIFYHPCICFNIFPKKVLITVPPHPQPPKKMHKT